MSRVITRNQQSNGRLYRIIRKVDVIANDCCNSHTINFDELEFIKVQVAVDCIFCIIWFDIKSYRITETDTYTKQLAKATKLLNSILD